METSSSKNQIFIDRCIVSILMHTVAFEINITSM